MNSKALLPTLCIILLMSARAAVAGPPDDSGKAVGQALALAYNAGALDASAALARFDSLPRDEQEAFVEAWQRVVDPSGGGLALFLEFRSRMKKNESRRTPIKLISKSNAHLATQYTRTNAVKLQRPATSGRGAIITGLIFNVIGYAAFVVGGAVAKDAPGVGLLLVSLGGAPLTVGSIVGTAGYQARHNAYVDAGFEVSTAAAGGAWALTALSIASYAASIGVGRVAIANEDTKLAFSSVGLAAAAGLFEIFNWLAVRPNWQRALDASKPKKLATKTSIYPVISSAATDAGPTTQFGLGGTF